MALLTEDRSGQAQSAALQAIGVSAKERDAAVPRSRRPFRVDVAFADNLIRPGQSRSAVIFVLSEGEVAAVLWQG